MNYLFVSCDIVGHSREERLEIQRDRVAGINRLVQQAMEATGKDNVVWASGGDGGHVAFAGDEAPRNAIKLLKEFATWSDSVGVALRITAHAGQADSIPGADGRVQLVGHGINRAGRILEHGSPDRVIVSDAFRQVVKTTEETDIELHNRRTLTLADGTEYVVWLADVGGPRVSQWSSQKLLRDTERLSAARAKHSSFELIYRAKRILQVNPDDRDAPRALRELAASGSLSLTSDNLVGELLREPEYIEQFVRSMTLAERLQGDVICNAGDSGQTMFLILTGELAGHWPQQDKSAITGSLTPDFRLTPGELAGELAFALRRRRTATLACSKDTSLLLFSYADFMDSLKRSKRGSDLERFVHRKLRMRIVEHVCNAAPFLIGKSFDNTASGPLRNEEQPWLDMLGGFDTREFSANDQIEISTSDSFFEQPGVYLLISGELQIECDRLSGEHETIIHAQLPGHVATEPRSFTLLDDAQIARISFECLRGFDRNIFEDIVTAIKASMPSAIKNQAQIRSSNNTINIWIEKLEYFREQEAITADPEQKFSLKKKIEEAEEKIRELGG